MSQGQMILTAAQDTQSSIKEHRGLFILKVIVQSLLNVPEEYVQCSVHRTAGLWHVEGKKRDCSNIGSALERTIISTMEFPCWHQQIPGQQN